MKLFFHHGEKSNDNISTLIIYTYCDNALRRLQPIYALAVSLFTYLANTAPIGLWLNFAIFAIRNTNKISENKHDLRNIEQWGKMPQVGYGVYQVEPKEAERCVSDAISVGYRMIDMAQIYHNEEGVGNAIAKCGVPREELFIVTKVWISNAGEKKAYASILESLKKL